MTKLSPTTSLMLYVALYPALSGCVTYFSLDPYLDKAVGQRVSDIRYPQLTYQKLMSDDGSRAVIQYSIDSLWRCRWIFEVEKASDVIKAWRYPDSAAAKSCQDIPSSMP
jgi:hypothetical protein